MSKKLPEADAPKEVKVLSLRSGDIVLADGQVLKFRGVVSVSEDVAKWLESSFKAEVQRV
jgi:uncharacterized protein (AIM24 family)